MNTTDSNEFRWYSNHYDSAAQAGAAACVIVDNQSLMSPRLGWTGYSQGTTIFTNNTMHTYTPGFPTMNHVPPDSIEGMLVELRERVEKFSF